MKNYKELIKQKFEEEGFKIKLYQKEGYPNLYIIEIFSNYQVFVYQGINFIPYTMKKYEIKDDYVIAVDNLVRNFGMYIDNHILKFRLKKITSHLFDMLVLETLQIMSISSEILKDYFCKGEIK